MSQWHLDRPKCVRDIVEKRLHADLWRGAVAFSPLCSRCRLSRRLRLLALAADSTTSVIERAWAVNFHGRKKKKKGKRKKKGKSREELVSRGFSTTETKNSKSFLYNCVDKLQKFKTKDRYRTSNLDAKFADNRTTHSAYLLRARHDSRINSLTC